MQPRRIRFDEVRAARASRFATRLAEALYELSITHRELARLLGITSYTVDSWTRVASPSLPGENNLDGLCALLDARKPGLGRELANLAGHTWTPAPEPPVMLRAVEHKPRSNLPAALTSFVGRERELQTLAALLSGTRLLTIAGPPGAGKSRLARELAASVRHDFRHGIWLVDLGDLTNSDALAAHVAAVLEVHGRPGLDALREHLQHKHLLLLLDNCEHLAAEVATLAGALLASTPDLLILVTSRETLRIAGETVYRLTPLPTSEPSATSPQHQYPAFSNQNSELGTRNSDFADPSSSVFRLPASVHLFEQRARLVRPNFVLDETSTPIVASIVARLDGLPLAIELCAAALQALTVEQIAARLADPFRLLVAGDRTAPPRHQTLRAAFDWSYRLLSSQEQELYAALSIFSGGWTLDAAEAVAGAIALPLLRSLVDKSLVLVEEAPPPAAEARYRLLTILRAYAQARLAANPAPDLARRHAEYYATLPNPAPADRANIEAALAWARGNNTLALDEQLADLLSKDINNEKR